jgi:hypothetical protein
VKFQKTQQRECAKKWKNKFNFSILYWIAVCVCTVTFKAYWSTVDGEEVSVCRSKTKTCYSNCWAPGRFWRERKKGCLIHLCINLISHVFWHWRLFCQFSIVGFNSFHIHCRWKIAFDNRKMKALYKRKGILKVLFLDFEVMYFSRVFTFFFLSFWKTSLSVKWHFSFYIMPFFEILRWVKV